ncbi:hypothetical protein QQ056_06585, partial [Oscillatoria laete-virens NRMC-F 0139]|nr:hypothetical protein [Oscillatoria laete-virens NRMC-F 0139]
PAQIAPSAPASSGQNAAPRQIAPAPPAATQPAAPAGAVDIQALWASIAQIAGNERPLIQSYITAGRPLALEGSTLVVGFNKANEFFVLQLNTPKQKDFIEEKLTGLAGRALTIGFRITDQVPAAAPAPMPASPAPAPKSEPAAPKPPADKPKSPVSETPVPPPDLPVTPPPREPQTKTMEDLKNDPFVKEALETFRARIIDYKPAKQ